MLPPDFSVARILAFVATAALGVFALAGRNPTSASRALRLDTTETSAHIISLPTMESGSSDLPVAP